LIDTEKREYILPWRCLMQQEARRRYDAEFKRDAVRLSEEAGKTVTEVARDLGIDVKILYRWRKDKRLQGEMAFPGHGRLSLTAEQKKFRELEKRLRDVTLERDILKKAVAIFSKTPK
jgi:transposase